MDSGDCDLTVAISCEAVVKAFTLRDKVDRHCGCIRELEERVGCQRALEVEVLRCVLGDKTILQAGIAAPGDNHIVLEGFVHCTKLVHDRTCLDEESNESSGSVAVRRNFDGEGVAIFLKSHILGGNRNLGQRPEDVVGR